MNLIEGLQAEVNRRREVLKQYEAVGSAGVWAAGWLKEDIRRAEAAIAGGDIVVMVRECKRLSEMEVK